MAGDRTTRMLTSLNGAPTNRVLNLATLHKQHAAAIERGEQPIFTSPALNTAIILKHRLRSDETYMFPEPRTLATKIIVPFAVHDLRMGGRSFFVAQRGYKDMLTDVGNYKGASMDRDLAILSVLDSIPSLDPFLVREHLREKGLNVSESYFALSDSDQQKMHYTVYSEIERLAMLAGDASGLSRSTQRLTEALLSNSVDDRLEPLRATLQLSPEQFKKSVFSWRGFLYYKWSMTDVFPQVKNVMGDIRVIQATGTIDAEQRQFITQCKKDIILSVRDYIQSVEKTLGLYDTAYTALVAGKDSKPFRDFLLDAPHLFVGLGEKIGAISHIASFWRYRFPIEKNPAAGADEIVTIFQDFLSSFSKLDQAKAA